MKAVINVTDCRDCPFRKSHRGHGECFEYCSCQSSNRKGYDAILWGCQEKFEAIPDWCPLSNESTQP